MIGPVARIGSAFRVGPLISWVVAIGAVVAVTVVAGVATQFNALPLSLVLVLGAFATAASFRWPLLSLALVAMFIPIEEVALIDGLGTISRTAAILFAVTYGLPRLGQLTLRAMPRAGWLYVAWAILSLGWAISPNAAIAELPTLLQLFILAILVADFVVHRPEIVRPVLWVYSLSATATALIAGAAYLTGAVSDDRGVALSGQDPAQFAALLLPALVFGLFEMFEGKQRILGAMVAVITSLGVIVSGTRGAWFAAVVIVLLFILPRFSVRRRVVAVGTVLVLMGVLYQVPGVANLIAERTGTALSTGGAGRTDIWTVGFTIYQSAPVTGVGYANFPISYTAQAVRAAGVTYASAFVVGRGPHNLVVGTLVELGPIGLVLLALFLGPLILRRGWGPDAATVQAALASLLAAALFLDVLSNRKQVWLLIGLAAGLAYLARVNGERTTGLRERWLGGRGSHGDPPTPPVTELPSATAGSEPKPALD